MPFCHARLDCARVDRRYLIDPQTFGQHLKRRRNEQALLQRELADQLGVGVNTVRKWERSTREPRAAFLPRLLDFLGYDPRPEAAGLADRLERARRGLGLTQQSLAQRLEIDESTVANYEAGRHGSRHTSVRRRLFAFIQITEQASRG